LWDCSTASAWRTSLERTGETMTTGVADVVDQAEICRTLYQFAAGI
jgi:hypothetical protein